MDVKEHWGGALVNWRLWGPPTVMSVILVAIAQFSFLGFHTLAELFAVVISFVMFALAWSTRRLSPNNFLLFLACGYFWVGALDLIHTFVYSGMDVFVKGSGNLSVQFWLGARFLESGVLFAAPFMVARPQNGYVLMGLFGAVAAAVVLLIAWDLFPTGFVEGEGLTPFKVYSEYVIVLTLVAALVALYRCRGPISRTEKTLISVSIAMTICAELAFTYYVGVFDLSNLAGHIFKLFSFWFIFRAIVLTNLEHPYALLRENEGNLRKALAVADRANKAKSDFLANMSHEIRTPLNAVIGFSQMLQSDVSGYSTPRKKAEYAENILTSGRHLHRLIGDILDLSKIEAGEMDLDEEDVDVKAVADECLVMMSDHVTRKRITLSSTVPDGLPRLHADRLRVKQILLNLLSNAAKFTPVGGAIEVAAVLEQGAMVLRVRDTGIGIATSHQERIFAPFNQSADSYTRTDEGAGLGLPLVRSLVALHGATIELDSQPGVGTTAVVRFPASRTAG